LGTILVLLMAGFPAVHYCQPATTPLNVIKGNLNAGDE
jgi:hypothetical protein